MGEKQMKTDTITNTSIEPASIVRFRWIYVFVLFPALLISIFSQGRFVSLSALELPFAPIPEPKLMERYIDPAHSDADWEPVTQTPVLPVVKKPSREDVFNPIILEAANRYRVEPAIIKAIIKAESRFNPKAVSKRGARGLMQLMPTTAKALGVDDSFNPEQNIHGGVKYYSQLLDQFNGDTTLALAAYNAGSRKVRKYKGVPPYRATKIYIQKVFEYHQEFKDEIIDEG
jgi:soluble lytic murein transglycosylase-like protein